MDKAALLVLGSHHSEQAWSIRVGPIAEELMRRSPCPVMLSAAVAISGVQLR